MITIAVLLISSCAWIDPDLGLQVHSDFSGDFFDGSAEITLVPASFLSVQYYSLDGSAVSRESIRYKGPFSINEETELRARAFYREKRGREVHRTFRPYPAIRTHTQTYSGENVYLLLANSPAFDDRLGYELTETSVGSARSISDSQTVSIVMDSEANDYRDIVSALERSRAISEENRAILDFSAEDISRSLQQYSFSTFQGTEVGHTRTISIDRYGTKISVQLAEFRSKDFGNSPVTAYIWVQVEDGANADVTVLSPEMINELADRFLDPDNRAIYDWAVDIAGQPWGTHNNRSMIPPQAAEEIHIVLKDMSNSMFAGYFWALHNYLGLSGSNEGLYFFLNSSMYARSDNSSWSPNGQYQQIMYSTIAHEFQHMINFYQKAVRKNNPSQTWLDELAAMVMEDLLADKLSNPGPRDLELKDNGEYDYGPGSSPGPNGRFSGRLSFYNTRPEYSLSSWGSGRGSYDILYDYALSYAFGAYLLRAYDGPPLLREIIQNPYSDYRAITEALKTVHGIDKSFGGLLLDFSEAALRSQHSSGGAKSLNSGEAGFPFSDSVFDFDYKLGSINLFHFNQVSMSISGNLELLQDLGPRAIPAGDIGLDHIFVPGSSHLLLLGENLEGSHSFSFRVPTGMDYRIIAIP